MEWFQKQGWDASNPLVYYWASDEEKGILQETTLNQGRVDCRWLTLYDSLKTFSRSYQSLSDPWYTFSAHKKPGMGVFLTTRVKEGFVRRYLQYIFK